MIDSAPILLLSRSATSPPTTAPTAPIAINAPYHRSLRCSRSWANSTKIAAVICMPSTAKLAATATPRRTRWSGQPTQALGDVGAQLRCGGAVGGRGFVATRSVKTSAAAIAKLAASNPNGSHIAATNSTLPIGVPTKLLAATSAANRRPLAFSRTSIGTIDGTIACEALSKNTSATPRQPAATHNIQIVHVVRRHCDRQCTDRHGHETHRRDHQQPVIDAIDEGTDRSENSSHGSAAATPMKAIDNSLRVSVIGEQRQGDEKYPVTEVGDRACRPQTPVGRREPSRHVSRSSPWAAPTKNTVWSE